MAQNVQKMYHKTWTLGPIDRTPGIPGSNNHDQNDHIYNGVQGEKEGGSGEGTP